MIAYDPAEWHDLFVACAGAAAALAGLLFVAISINLERILAYPTLPARALEAVVLLGAVLIVSLFGLVPDVGRTTLGVELLVIGLVATAVATASIARNPGEVRWLGNRIALTVPGTALYAVGGVSLMAGAGGGLYWILAGIVAAFIGSLASAWVLLVEIQR